MANGLDPDCKHRRESCKDVGNKGWGFCVRVDEVLKGAMDSSLCGPRYNTLEHTLGCDESKKRFTSRGMTIQTAAWNERYDHATGTKE